MHADSLVPPIAGAAGRWAALDEPDELREYSRAAKGHADGVMESFLAIEGMHCAACALTVESVLVSLRGVCGVQVNGAAATARIEWSPVATRPSQWIAALAAAGYGAVPAGDLLQAAPRVKEQRLLLWQWLVAGFCMMQVMMYAVPAYVAGAGDITPDIARLLGWASWVLTLPVVLFSCWPFFRSALRDLRNRTIGMDVPVALGIAIAFGASSAAMFDPTGPLGQEVWFDSITMFVFFLLSGRLLEQRLRDRTAGSLEALMRRLPQTVLRRRGDGDFERVPVRRLAAGDVVRVLAGENLPADGWVLEGTSSVDEALLTGESRPVQRHGGDAVIAGSQNVNGTLLVQVERTGQATHYAGIVALMEQASMDKPRLARLADRIAAPFMLGVVVAAALAALWWWPTDHGKALGVAIAVLIVTCPCALSLATPAATLAAAGALARRGVLVRRLQALETCASVDTVVFDKTGTLTNDRLGLVAVHCRADIHHGEALALAGAIAQHSLHPAARSIADAAGASDWTATASSEVAGRGIRGRATRDGGVHAREVRLGSASFCGVPPRAHQPLCTEVHLADEAGWMATFELDEALRPDALPALSALGALGIHARLLSGDHDAAAQRLAACAGIESAAGDCSPQDKLERIRQLQQKGGRVLMVGDGLNDGPVLAGADVSIAMGQGAPIAQAKSDFVIPGGQLASVPALIAHARRTRRIVRQNLAWAAAYNAVCVPLAIAGAMPPWLAGLGMATSSLLVVANSSRLSRISPGH
ncbi:MAG: cation-translocating P-type ATPase [Ramlibacter sp.]